MAASEETPQRVPVGTAIVITNPAGKVLMIKRWGKHGQGTWSVPGGWADPGEDPVESACREALEEVGLEIDPSQVDFLGYTHNMYPEGIEDVCLWFRARSWAGEPTICEPEKIKALEWRDWDALPEPLFIGFEGAFSKGIIPA
jgi:8-oxo-dGTP diphosphatase